MNLLIKVFKLLIMIRVKRSMKSILKSFTILALIMTILTGCHFFFPVWSHSKWENSKLEVPFCSGSDKPYDVSSLKNKIDKNTYNFSETDLKQIQNISQDVLKNRELENAKKKKLLKTYGYIKLDMPWDYGGKKAILQEREFCGAMQPTGCSTEIRLHSSSGHKKDYINEINKYLSKKDWLKSLQTRSYSPKSNNAGYKIVSINPTIVIIIPKKEETNIISTKYGKCYVNSAPHLYSRHLQSKINVGTKFNFHQNIQWFSPDLNRGPEKLHIRKNGSFNIKLEDGSIIFTEKNGEILTKRL